MPDELSENRVVTQRVSYLKRATELRENEAKAIAWSERGYSHAAIARKLETSKSTVSGWIERAMARYGLAIGETLLPDDLEPPLSEPDYEQVGPEYIDELETDADRERWAECVEDNADSLPASWVNDIIDELERRGYFSLD